MDTVEDQAWMALCNATRTVEALLLKKDSELIRMILERLEKLKEEIKEEVENGHRNK